MFPHITSILLQFSFSLFFLGQLNAVIQINDFNNNIIDLPSREEWGIFSNLHQVIIGILAKPSRKVERYYGIHEASPFQIKQAIETGSERLIFTSFDVKDWDSLDHQMMAWLSCNKKKELLKRNDFLMLHNPHDQSLLDGQNLLFLSMKHDPPGELGFELFQRVFSFNGFFDSDVERDDGSSVYSLVSISLSSNKDEAKKNADAIVAAEAAEKQRLLDESSKAFLFTKMIKKMLNNSDHQNLQKESTYADIKIESKSSSLRFIKYAIQCLQQITGFKQKSYNSSNAMFLKNSHNLLKGNAMMKSINLKNPPKEKKLSKKKKASKKKAALKAKKNYYFSYSPK